MNEFATKISVIKNCGSGMGCWYASPVKFLGGGISTSNLDNTWNSTYSKAILNDGTMIMLSISNWNCAHTFGTPPVNSPVYASVCGTINIDLNGATGPNQEGRDHFAFLITKNGIYPTGTFNDGYTCNINSSDYYSSLGCTAKVLQESAINY